MLLKHFTTVSFYTALSRISGFARDIIMARYLGAGPLSDAFLIALRVPNFFRRFFAEGALNTAFIPLFSRRLEGEGKEAARKMAEEVFVFLFVILTIFSGIFMLFMPYLIIVIAPGLTFGEAHMSIDLVVELTRITFPYLFFISIATLFSGILNSISKFAAVSFMPVLFNVALILSMVFFSRYFTSIVYALSWGVFFAGILQVIWMIYFLHKNDYLIGLKFRLLRVTENVREFFKKLLPTALGGGVVQINLWVDLMIASFFSGAVTYLYYADRVAQLPLSLIGTAMGTALLPALSRNLGSGNITEANKINQSGLEVVLFLTLPAAFALMILPFDIMHVLFVRGEFTGFDANMAAWAMAAFAMGLPSFALVKIYSSCFFALKDTKTPVISATYAMLINIGLNIVFVFTLSFFNAPPHIGIALATSIAGWFNAHYLGHKLYKTTSFSLSDIFNRRLFKISVSCVLMIAALFPLTFILSPSLTNLAIEIVVGGGVYIACILLLKTFTLDALKNFITRKNRVA